MTPCPPKVEADDMEAREGESLRAFPARWFSGIRFCCIRFSWISKVEILVVEVEFLLEGSKELFKDLEVRFLKI